jgi:rubrerythrin
MNEMEALELALARERQAHKYYSEAAARSTHGASRRMFNWLASEEIGHMAILEKQCKQMRGGGTWLTEEGWKSCADLSNPVERSEFPALSELKAEPKPDLPELDILSQAIDAEREATSFYSDLADQVSHPDGKTMLEKLSRVEQGHLDLLEEEREWLKKSRVSFPLHRFPPGAAT